MISLIADEFQGIFPSVAFCSIFMTAIHCEKIRLAVVSKIDKQGSEWKKERKREREKQSEANKQKIR